MRILVLVAVIAPSAAWASSAFSATRGTRPIKAVGAGFAASARHMRIADTSTPFAFHAHADFVWLPYCDEITALRYLEKKRVTHIVVRGYSPGSRPYLKKWMENGVPNARLVAQTISGTGEKVLVYDVRRSGGS
jgi:hypothetical protein